MLHAVLINLGFGLAFTLAALLGGRWLYTTFGLSGPSLEAAMAYSNIAFGGSALLWVFNALASAIRGTGNMALPAKVIIGGVVFADAGKTWAPRVGPSTDGIRKDAGVGLLIESTRAALLRVIRVEVAMPDQGGKPVFLISGTSLF